MTVAGSVSQLIALAKDGDEDAFSDLHRRYWPQIVGIAASRLNGNRRTVTDADDLAQRAFIDLHLGFRNRRMPRLETRHQFLALMSHIVACKVLNEIRHATAARRGGSSSRFVSVCELLTESPDTGPVQSAILNDCYNYYVNGLPEKLRPFADMHLAGMTSREIADEMGCVQ